MFLRWIDPRSTALILVCGAIESKTGLETTMPSGGANSCNRAATLTPRPNTSPKSRIVESTLTPIRNLILRSPGWARSVVATSSCRCIAHSTASSGESKEAIRPSPVFLTMRPRNETTQGSMVRTLSVRSRVCVSSSAISVRRE